MPRRTPTSLQRPWLARSLQRYSGSFVVLRRALHAVLHGSVEAFGVARESWLVATGKSQRRCFFIIMHAKADAQSSTSSADLGSEHVPSASESIVPSIE